MLDFIGHCSGLPPNGGKKVEGNGMSRQLDVEWKGRLQGDNNYFGSK